MNTPYDYWAARDAALAVEFASVALSNVEVVTVAALVAALMAMIPMAALFLS
jgi:hypothetical protein